MKVLIFGLCWPATVEKVSSQQSPNIKTFIVTSEDCECWCSCFNSRTMLTRKVKLLPSGAFRCFPVVPPCFPVARRRRKFHPPANAPHAAVAYYMHILNIVPWRWKRGGTTGSAAAANFFLNFKFVDCQLTPTAACSTKFYTIENNNILRHGVSNILVGG
jgi:hypothetical protein